MMTVLYIPNGLDIFGGCSTSAQGFYQYPGDIVWVCKDQEDPTYIQYHEIGHWVWFNYLNDHARAIYTKIYNRSTSKYDLYEDFAHSYAQWKYGIIPSKVGTLKYKFFDILNYDDSKWITSNF